MNKIKFLFFYIIILVLLSQSNIKYENYLDNEFSKFFPIRSEKDYITKEYIQHYKNVYDKSNQKSHLDSGGNIHYRSFAENHIITPEIIMLLQKAKGKMIMEFLKNLPKR